MSDDAVERRGEDRDPDLYARKRARASRRRIKLERSSFDPRPATDDDWTVEDRSELRRLPTAPTPLADAMRDLVGARRWTDRLTVGLIDRRWAEIVGAELAGRCHPARIAGGILTVAVDDALWATQLKYLADRIRLQVNQTLGEPLVDRVEVVVGRRRA